MFITPTIHLGSPSQADPLTIFPVWTNAPIPRRALHTSLPPGATVDELEHQSVAHLGLHNPTQHTFLLPGGSIFDAGWQHRVLIHSVLVAPEMSLNLDVRCVEEGRWGGARRQRMNQRRAPLAVRSALGGDERADQGEVWSRVQRYEGTIGHSASTSLFEVTEGLQDDIDLVLKNVKVIAGQRGMLIGIGGHPVLLEVFDHPRTLARQAGAIIAGVFADAQLIPTRHTPGRHARAFIRRLSRRPMDPRSVAGAARAVQVRDDLVAAEGLVSLEGPAQRARMIHLSALNTRHELVAA